jgi:hypothetical protein
MKGRLGGHLMKQIVLTLVVSLVLGSGVFVARAEAQTTTFSSTVRETNAKVVPEELRQMLNKGLRTARDNEKEYVDWVVAWVEKDKLPVSLVYASFRYARTRRPHYPFPYFVYSLETLIARNKIVLTND